MTATPPPVIMPRAPVFTPVWDKPRHLQYDHLNLLPLYTAALVPPPPSVILMGQAVL